MPLPKAEILGKGQKPCFLRCFCGHPLANLEVSAYLAGLRKKVPKDSALEEFKPEFQEILFGVQGLRDFFFAEARLSESGFVFFDEVKEGFQPIAGVVDEVELVCGERAIHALAGKNNFSKKVVEKVIGLKPLFFDPFPYGDGALFKMSLAMGFSNDAIDFERFSFFVFSGEAGQGIGTAGGRTIRIDGAAFLSEEGAGEIVLLHPYGNYRKLGYVSQVKLGVFFDELAG